MNGWKLSVGLAENEVGSRTSRADGSWGSAGDLFSAPSTSEMLSTKLEFIKSFRREDRCGIASGWRQDHFSGGILSSLWVAWLFVWLPLSLFMFITKLVRVAHRLLKDSFGDPDGILFHMVGAGSRRRRGNDDMDFKRHAHQHQASVASINRSPCPASPSLQFDPNRQCWSTPFCLLPRHSIAFISLFLFLTSYRAFELTQRGDLRVHFFIWSIYLSIDSFRVVYYYYLLFFFFVCVCLLLMFATRWRIGPKFRRENANLDRLEHFGFALLLDAGVRRTYLNGTWI